MPIEMTVGIVSDTHMPHRGKALPKALIQGLQGVDLILHAGDWTAPYVLKLFEEIAPVEGIIGNNDDYELFQRLGKRKLLTLAGIRIGMIHGDGYGKTTETTARDAFGEDEVDLIIFGHSHTPYHQVLDGVLMFNPGSPTDKRRQTQYSYGIMKLGDDVKLEHHYYSDKS